VVSGSIIDKFGNWELPFVVNIALMALGVAMTSRMRPGLSFNGTPAHSAM
jgi:hypothetical protein